MKSRIENPLFMNKYISIILLATAAACSSTESGDLEAKKKELEEAQKQYAELREKISTLESEIAAQDPEFAKQLSKAVLVSAFDLKTSPFQHRVEVRGTLMSRKNVSVSSEMAGTITDIKVKEGQSVKAGQPLITLDSEILRNSVSELKKALELANTVYEKQAKLWEQKIGTEMQYLQAKNNKESLERRLATANSQLEQTVVKAPFNGTVDNVSAREGELATPGIPLLRLVSLDNMYINADVSEKFIGRFKPGDDVMVYFPAQDKEVKSQITAVSQVINLENRTFTVEVQLPRVDFVVKPNQIVVLHLSDYVTEEAVVVPTKIILQDEDGKFVYAIEKRNEKLVASKKYITTGESYSNKTEIREGLKGNEKLVLAGYRELSEGAEVKIDITTEASGLATGNN